MNSIKGIISFVVLSIVFYLVLMFGLSKVKYNGASMIIQTNDFYYLKGGDTYAKFNDFDEEQFYDIVFVGSSRSYRHYNPAFFNPSKLNTWNLGSSSQILRNSKLIIKGYLNKENCNVIVLDLFPAAFNNPGLESSSDLIANVDKNDVAINIAKEMQDSRAMDLLVNRFMTLGDGPSFEEDDYVGKGFCAHLDTIKKDAADLDESEIKDLQINNEQLSVLEDILKYCNSEGVQLVLAISPSSNYFHEKTHQQFLEILMPLVNQYNVPFFDYAKSLPLKTTEHFYDDSHMNIEGVKIFNKTFYEDLKKANFVE